MPRKRAELEREEKVEEILEHAVRLVRAGGYEELSINRVAKDLGLARAAVYWYFPSRADLFVAACERVFAEMFAGPPSDGGAIGRIRWGVDRLDGVCEIYLALQQLSATEQVAATLLADIHQRFQRGLREALAPTVEPERLERVVDAVLIFAEGLLGRRLPHEERDRHLEFALAALLGDER
ncbi:TetR family transcriptional regulator [Herbihabitans rhizosphaerae]|uniref:TetR family transcriptional regulator n=1 Tax=Herbihabitans rhizosphaerae TaxID=1872711 RepID=A0A4Q7L4D5_9PSEU|nr:TetR/AcrR family transcriptional regulator [Herbihabitans rhizosphaerae]RZS44135.1 TetR family transcriptional regulator [Herbihabitans rhizosphaerae]